MATPLTPQSINDVPEKLITITQTKYDESIRKAMGRAAVETRAALAVAQKRIAELEQMVNKPTLQLEDKLRTAHVAINDARETLMTALAQLS